MIALYKDTFSKEFKTMSHESLIQLIVEGQFKEYIEYLRRLGKSEYDAEKKSLPAATWSGIFKKDTRAIESLEKYSGLVCLDIDKLEESTINVLKNQLVNDPFVLYCFVSPSAKGLKIIVKVNTGPEHHRSAFLHLQKVFEDKYLVKVDPSGKDVSRLCYVSYDPYAIIKQSQVFEVDIKYGEIIPHNMPTTIEGFKHTQDSAAMYAVAVGWVNRNKTYVEGERNVYIHALACALNRLGMNMDETINMIQLNLPVPDIKWHQSVRSAYFHNQAEHGTKQIKEIGVTDFIAPPYIANFTDDVAADDLMRITATLYSLKVPPAYIMDLVNKISKYYDSMGYIDMRRNNLTDMMNQAIQVLNSNVASNAEKASLKYTTAEEMGREIIKMDLVKGLIPTYIPGIDEAMYGGMLPGNVYGMIGLGGTFKSIVAQNIAYQNALNDIPTLILNGEMSAYQVYERIALMSMGIDLRTEMFHKRINENNIDSFIEKLKEFLKGNIFVFNGSGFNYENIIATVEHIRATTGKIIRLIIADGLSQFDPKGKEEIPATIFNSGVCKEIAKATNSVVMPLIHLSGDAAAYTLRDTGMKVRGGIKTLANLDGYFSTSKLVDPLTQNLENPEEVIYLEGKIYLRLTDKRTRSGVLPTIVNVGPKLNIDQEFTDPRSYEVDKNKRNN